MQWAFPISYEKWPAIKGNAWLERLTHMLFLKMTVQQYEWRSNMTCDFLQNNNKLTEFLLQGTLEQNIPVSFKSKFNKRGNKKHVCIRLVGLQLEGKNYHERNTVKETQLNNKNICTYQPQAWRGSRR